MTNVFEWVIANAACAIALAIPAYFSSYLRRPAVTHALWLLVLLRLVAPPLWRVPVTEAATAQVATTIESAPAAVVAPAGDEEIEPFVWADEAPPLEQTSVTVEPVNVAEAATPVDWRMLVLAGWACGCAVVMVLTVARVRAFRRMLRFTQSAPDEWRIAAANIAENMGLRRTPDVRLTHGSITPLLWAGFGRPVLLLPAEFAAKLDADRRATLIAHELAHFRRGDHYVRWLELVVTIAFWWHPVVWLARRELREAEEQLCDAWVVWTLPEVRRAYAAALVDTVDFLHESGTATPALASGLGEVRNLQRRIVMIMRDRVPRRLTRLGLAFGLTAGLFALGLSPGRADAQARPPAAPRPPEPVRPPEPPEPPDDPRPPREPRAESRRAANPEQNQEAEEIRNEMRRMRQALSRLENRLQEIEGRGGEGRGGAARSENRRPVEGRREGGPPEGLPPRREEPGAAGGPGAFIPPGGRPGGPGFGPGSAPGGGGPGPGPMSGGGGGRGVSDRGMAGMGGMPPDLSRRLEEMQRNMEEMRREMGELRRMLRSGSGGSVPTPSPANERRERRSSDTPAPSTTPAIPGTPAAPAPPAKPRPIDTAGR